MRECGILMPIFSLPSPCGIGAFSKEAYEFIDRLEEAGQRYWQILPLGPTGYGDSPYQSFSAFAGNPYFIDLEQLRAEGLLTSREYETAAGTVSRYIDYKQLYDTRFLLLRRAYGRWLKQVGEDRAGRMAEEGLCGEALDYCFYMAVKNVFGGQSWNRWDEDIRLRRPGAVARYRRELAGEIGFYQFQQLKFMEQWRRLKEYAHSKGVRIIGDIPIYVALDSADTWVHPELFQFDEDNHPVAVAGCPPDGFSATGQLWGNPLYRWDYHRQTGYEWWLERMEYSLDLYDLVRVDHFRGFDSYYSIPYGDETAENGTWEPGPGLGFFHSLRERFGGRELPIIAEDLGFLTESVRKLVRDTGFPGMKVLEFAFDSREAGDYLPYNYEANCVVYTGTHDNDTILGWYEAMAEDDREFSIEYLNNGETKRSEIHWDFVRAALSSVARLAVIPVQDYLGLGTSARINVPSTLGENWKWRLLPDEFNRELAARCRRMAEIYGRITKEANGYEQ